MSEILVVDLDGTLLRSDLLFESFWSAFSKDWRTPVRALSALPQGRAALKKSMAQAAQMDVSTLPYDSKVLSYVRAWRDAGGRTALVTAADETIAQDIGRHLGLFDEVHGSDGVHNLKGAQKAQFLVERFGAGKFAYMGDDRADLPIWKEAGKAITVNASGRLRAQAEQVAAEPEHLQSNPPTLAAYLRALRPHQWLKNLLVFLPILAAHQIDAANLMLSLLAFVAFSLVASSVYVLNDLLDLGADRAHPRKRFRPFAAGHIPIAAGLWMALGLLATGAVIASLLGPSFFGAMAVYYVLTIAYSLYFKRRIVIDICVLASLYTIRILAGGAATQVELSVWMLAFSMFLFLSLAAVKRQAELVDTLSQGTKQLPGRGYHVNDLPIISMISISAGYVSVLVMALYINAPAVVELYAHSQALWGVCAVLLYWITRTVMITNRGKMQDDPVIYALQDRQSQLCGLIILVCVVVGAVL